MAQPYQERSGEHPLPGRWWTYSGCFATLSDAPLRPRRHLHALRPFADPRETDGEGTQKKIPARHVRYPKCFPTGLPSDKAEVSKRIANVYATAQTR